MTKQRIRTGFNVFLCGSLWLSVGAAADQPAKVRLHVVASASTLRNVNHTDAQAAGRVWIDALAAAQGFQSDTRFNVADSLEEIRKEVDAYTSDLFILDSFEYFRLGSEELVPFVAMDQTSQKYALIARCDGNCPALEDLRGKRTLYYPLNNAQIGQVWLDTLLAEKNLGRVETFLNIVSSPKSSSACLPVFFGNADACIITMDSWNLLREMNPQVGRKLSVIATSPAYFEGMVCVHKLHKDHLEELRQGLQQLSQSAEGRQLLMVFKVSRVIPMKNAFLDEIRNLWNRYRALPPTGKPLEKTTDSAVRRPL